MLKRLRFWDRWVKTSSDASHDEHSTAFDTVAALPNGTWDRILDLVLDEAVFWCTVVFLITTAAISLGVQLETQKSDPGNETDIALYALLWQALIQLLTNYCTVVPVLREQRQRQKGPYSSSSSHHRHAFIKVHHVVFYGCVIGSVVATIFAPVFLKALPAKFRAVSDIANFASNIFAATAASQLAAGITSGLRSRE
ncbi:hypothetical protein PG988_011805 [Apiospora saccharicola]